jgi:hypothetical protein
MKTDMINYKEIESRYNDPVLNADEKLVLNEMEKYTDKAIEIQFRNAYKIYVDFNDLDKLASKFGIHRQRILMEHWKNVCKHSGWSVEFDSNYDGSSWILTQLQ